MESRFEEEGRWLQQAQDAENVDMSTLFPQAEAEPNCAALEELHTHEETCRIMKEEISTKTCCTILIELRVAWISSSVIGKVG